MVLGRFSQGVGGASSGCISSGGSGGPDGLLPAPHKAAPRMIAPAAMASAGEEAAHFA